MYVVSVYHDGYKNINFIMMMKIIKYQNALKIILLNKSIYIFVCEFFHDGNFTFLELV